MASSKEHYERVLSPVYAWMYGGFPAALDRNAAFFRRYGLSPTKSKSAVDLGAGCGFQSIPLAQLGYQVTAIDLDAKLLRELLANSDGLAIDTIEDDLLQFGKHLSHSVELVVCMTDTLLHLESCEDVRQLITSVYVALEGGGRFIVTFRDLTHEVKELDRFIPVRSDADTVFTCFLEYEPETVKVHDLVYRRISNNWEFTKSYYRKLRLSKEWVSAELASAGFADVESDTDKGVVTLIVAKPE